MSNNVTYPTHNLNPELINDDQRLGQKSGSKFASNNGGFDNDDNGKFDVIGTTNANNYGDEGPTQTQAMTEEVYADHVQMADQDSKSKSKAKGCWSGTVNFVRSFWATRWTIDANEKETLIKTTIRELVIYIIFLAVLCMITFNMTSTTYYYYTNVMQNLFLKTASSDGNTFKSMNAIEHWWNYVEPEGPLMSGIYWDTWYNNDPVAPGEDNFIFHENKLLGVPRIRQLRVKKNTCTVHQDFENEIEDCYAEYSTANQETESFGNKNNNAFLFKTEDELNGSGFTSPILKINYDGAGYVQDLDMERNTSEFRLQQLKADRWLDRQTRIVFIDFAVYNANINLFCVVRIWVD